MLDHPYHVIPCNDETCSMGDDLLQLLAPVEGDLFLRHHICCDYHAFGAAYVSVVKEYEEASRQSHSRTIRPAPPDAPPFAYPVLLRFNAESQLELRSAVCCLWHSTEIVGQAILNYASKYGYNGKMIQTIGRVIALSAMPEGGPTWN